MYPRFTDMCLISDDVLKLASFYAGLLQTSVEGDATFAIVRGHGAVLSVLSRAGME
jgi:hypothetical protein